MVKLKYWWSSRWLLRDADHTLALKARIAQEQGAGFAKTAALVGTGLKSQSDLHQVEMKLI